MKTLEEIFAQTDITKIQADLTVKNLERAIPEWNELEKEFDPTKHDIFDTAKFPDKIVKEYTKNEKGEDVETSSRKVEITRIGLGLQKLSAARISQFMFTLSVNTVLEDDEGDSLKDQFKALTKILKKNRWDSLNKKRCKITSSQCECAVYWYVVDTKKKHKAYGFETTLKLRSAVFSPELGDELFPLFDDTGDMIAFSRKYRKKEGDQDVDYFDTWTADKIYQWKQAGNGWEPVRSDDNPIEKIPIVYTTRHQPIWRDADNKKVHEIEKILSENGEIISYHASPALIIYGNLIGAPKKGSANKVFQTDDKTKGGAEYISWKQSPESIRFQVETLLRLFWMELQLPDLSFENIKGLGAQSGESRKWLLADAHLKVGEESEIYLDAISRDYNIIKALIGQMNLKWKDKVEQMELTAEIRPFTIEDEKANIEVITAANGGKPVISHELSVKYAGMSEDPAADYEQIKKEESESRVVSIQDSAE